MFGLEHYFALRKLSAVCEAFGDAYPDKEVQDKK
jgi:hypothetical protein